MIRTGDHVVSEIVENRQKYLRAKKRWERNWRDLAMQKWREYDGVIPRSIFDQTGSYLYEALPDGSWKGHRCFIIGGGPSLRDFDFSRLKGELVIGINRAYEKLDCTIMFSMDSRYYQWILRKQIGGMARERFFDFKGYKVWLDTFNFPYHGIYLLRANGKDGVSTSMTHGLSHGSNSGHAAINLAICLGANPIYLLGFDMKGENGKQDWWHDGYPAKQPQSVYRKYKERLENTASTIKGMGFRVINLNPDSALKCYEFGRFENLKPIRRPIFVSYCTVNSGYELEVKRLEASLRRFNLEYDIQKIQSLGDWQRNTHYKAQFIKTMLEKHNRPVCFLDADAVVWKYPFAFNDMKADMAVHFRDYNNHPSYRRSKGRELLSGTIYFDNSEKAKELINKWITANAMNPGKWEQKNLQDALEGWDGEIAELPATYCKIFDSMEYADKAVIEHYQASRRLRYEANHGQ